MCKRKDEGPRCDKHAIHALKTANKKYVQIAKEAYKNPSPENFAHQSQAKKEHRYFQDVRHSTTTGLSIFSKYNPDYKKHEKFHNLLKDLGRNKNLSSESETVGVGTHGTIRENVFVPNLDGEDVVVKQGKKRTVLWNEREPTKLIILNRETQEVKESYVPVKLNGKPDIQWVIWNVNINEFFPKF